MTVKSNPSKNDSWQAPKTVAAQLVTGLFRSRNHIISSDQHVVARNDLTWMKFSTLVALRYKYPSFSMSPTEIYSAAQVTSGGLAKMLRELESEGLIKRIDNPKDRRSRYVQLTRVGVKTVESIVEELVEINTRIFDDILTKKECALLAKILSKLSAGLDDLANR